MGTVVLISCVKKKLPNKARAGELYNSPFFKYMLRYAETYRPKKIFVLSAKYGLVGIDEEIEPYDLTLNTMSLRTRKNWADNVLVKLKKETNVESDEFVILAGNKYREFLLADLPRHVIPLMGMGIGEQLKFLKEHVDD